jgi:DNA-binding SARP family transcriptional activator
MFENNPFYYRGPIRHPEDFYNRKVEVRRALHFLRAGQSVSVVGPRKIGKTSFLFHISNPKTFEEYGLASLQYLLVYVDCEGLYDLTREELYRYILDEISDKLAEEEIELRLEVGDETTTYLEFARAIKSITKKRRLVLIFDEFEGISTNPNLDTGFFAGLRGLSIQHKVALVTASKLPLDQIHSAKPDSLLSSHFFNIFLPLRLQLFNIEDSHRLIQESLTSTGITFSADTLDWVLRVGGRHPFFLQLAGDCAFELQATKGAVPSKTDHELLEERIKKEAAGHFRYYWNELNAQEQYVLAILPRLGGRCGYRETVGRLRDQCLIGDTNSTGYDYFSPLFGDFVAEQQVFGLLRAGPLVIDHRQRQAFLRGYLLELTDLSYDLVVYLMKREGETVSAEELDREVWQPADPTSGEERVKKAINSLRQKLGDDANLIITRRGRGYTFLTNPPT